MKQLNGTVELEFDIRTGMVNIHQQKKLLSDVLKQVRVRIGYTVKQLSELTGIDMNTIILLENNRLRQVTVRQLITYCNSLLISLKGVSGGMVYGSH